MLLISYIADPGEKLPKYLEEKELFGCRKTVEILPSKFPTVYSMYAC